MLSCLKLPEIYFEGFWKIRRGRFYKFLIWEIFRLQLKAVKLIFAFSTSVNCFQYFFNSLKEKFKRPTKSRFKNAYPTPENLNFFLITTRSSKRHFHTLKINHRWMQQHRITSSRHYVSHNSHTSTITQHIRQLLVLHWNK